jgi:glycosyltransferase involved in cell wall biosynthesis
MNVLFIIDHAPDYRESFFRSLSQHCNLTVLSHPCEPDGLSAPEKRVGYTYIEIPAKNIGPFKFANVSHLDPDSYDILCVALNPRHIWRAILFLKNKKLWKKWVWWGQIYGKSESILLQKMRLFLLHRSASILTYSKDISKKLKKDVPDTPVLSFNNTQAQISDFTTFKWPSAKKLRFIFVGRPQHRKRLDRIVTLAKRLPYTEWRLIGPEMEHFMTTNFGTLPENIECFGKTTGNELKEHFAWCHAVINPGHLGLLVSNAALHGRPVIIQKNEQHAPEIALAEESDQIFTDFDSPDEVDELFFQVQNDVQILIDSGRKLQEVAQESYSIEYMVKSHLDGFKYALQ